MTSSSTAAIRLEDVRKTYRLGFFMNRQVQALENLSLEVQRGEIFGLLGPNGAGKSTTIKILMNLVQATSGTAEVLGHAPSHTAARARVGFLPENPAPYEYLTGREFVTLAGRLSNVPSAEIEGRVGAMLERVGMKGHADIQIRRYSKGMVQRVALAQALIGKPDLLILDEPTSGLDPVGRREMRDIILEEKSRGTTVLFCSHIISDVESLCDRVAVLTNGRLARLGSVESLLSTQVPTLELTVERLTREALDAIGVPLRNVRPLGERWLVSVEDANAQELMKRLLAAEGRIVKVTPERFSLEDLFMQTLGENKSTSVGGIVS